MLDQSGRKYYLKYFEDYLKWCEEHFDKSARNEGLTSEDFNKFKSEVFPEMNKLKEYLLEQIRSVQHDDSILKKILKGKKRTDDIITHEENLLFSTVSFYRDVASLVGLIDPKESFLRLGSLYKVFARLTEDIDELDVKCAFLAGYIYENRQLLLDDVPEHQKEMKRVLQDLVDTQRSYMFR